MEQAISEHKSPFATEPIGRLIAKFAIHCVISLLVNSLYNIVDQIFIGWGVGYLGNGATNVVFPITIIALALSLMIGDGGAAYLSLKLGEGNIEQAKKGVGNAVTMVTAVSIVLLVVFLIWIDPILTLFGATDVLRPYHRDGTVQQSAGQIRGRFHLRFRDPADRIPDGSSHLSAGDWQTCKVGAALAVPADHLLCAGGGDPPCFYGSQGRPLDKACGRWTGLCSFSRIDRI